MYRFSKKRSMERFSVRRGFFRNPQLDDFWAVGLGEFSSQRGFFDMVCTMMLSTSWWYYTQLLPEAIVLRPSAHAPHPAG